MEAALEVGGKTRKVIIVSVHLCHATTLKELLRYGELRNSWKLLNRDHVKALMDDCFLHAISTGILPVLADNPTDERHINLLLFYAQGSCHEVGGLCSHKLNGFTDNLLDHVRDAELHPLVIDSWLVAKSSELIDTTATLRSRQMNLSLDDS